MNDKMRELEKKLKAGEGKANNLDGVATSCFHIGREKKQQNEFDTALIFLKRSRKLARQVGAKKREMESCQQLYEIYKEQHEYEKAFNCLQNYTTIKEDLFNIEKSRQFAEMQTKYEACQKEKEAEIYREKNAELERKIVKNKLVEEKLRKLSRAVEQSASTIVITDHKGTIEFVNPAFTRITGYTYNEALGQNPRVLKSDKHPPKFYQNMWQTLMRGDVWAGEMVNKRKNGDLYWENATISPIKNANGEVTHYVAVKEDITKRKLAEEAVHKAHAELVKKNAEIEKERKKSDTLLLNILPAKVAEDLKESGKTEPQAFDDVTVFFSDFASFTQISSMIQPKYLIGELSRIFTAFDEIMEKHDCERIKTIGDAYLAVCGMPEPNPNHAGNMIRAAIDIIHYLQTRNQESDLEWLTRIGIHSGPVVGGIVGVKKYIYDVFGDTINTASRMESHSQPMRINVSGETYRLVKKDFHFMLRKSILVKGKGKMDMYYVKE